MHISWLSHYSRAVSMLSFVFVTILTLISIFSTHSEMPRAFKAASVALLFLSGCLIRCIATTLYTKGCICMVYTLILHGTLLFVLILGARMGSHK
ncbi:hypothetical protein KMI_03g05020 [Encephalitozoon hellem]|uniref:Uncharacterized protein n=1 Tax=Encephalitozoon hellem TaxID=27973 RepID=A0ABY8CNK2_ENCHE|nr:hypothetical protein KMI_03g05020 [Encephalitozoon hellem]WEL38815.1 hypothetical protein PFJ87_06g00810 [Encephalitozoon hellem]